MSDMQDAGATAGTTTGPGVAQAAAVSAAAADATRTGASDADAGAGKPDQTPKPPPRPPEEVRADIVKERAALGASFDGLREDLDDAVDAARERVASVGRKARVAAPLIGAGLAVALYLRSRARDRR